MAPAVHSTRVLPSETVAASSEATPPPSPSGKAEKGEKVDEAARPRPERVGLWRLVLLAVTLVAMLVVGRVTGAAGVLDVAHIGRWVQGTGVFGWAIIAGIMALGEMVHVPAVVTYSACIMIYGKTLGFFVGWVAVMVSVSFSFVVVRAVGGDSLVQTKNKHMQRMLAQLDERPVVTVLLLRIVLFAAPALNFALALSGVSFRHYFVGSAVGVIPPLLVFALTIDWFVSTHNLLMASSLGESPATPVPPVLLLPSLANLSTARNASS